MNAKLNSLLNTPFEQWKQHGVHLKSVSANADGIVNSGITSTGVYFYRKYDYNDGVHTNPRFVTEGN